MKIMFIFDSKCSDDASAEDRSNNKKSIIGKEIFKKHREVKRKLWGGKFWTSGYYMNTVGQYANEGVIKRYVENQGRGLPPDPSRSAGTV